MLPVLYVQFNVFQCGGIAIAICISHKSADADSITNFLRNWADNNMNMKDLSKAITPSFEESSLRFPPFKTNPSHQISIMEKFFFNERKRTTRRFVFYAKAMMSLKEKAKGEIRNGEKVTPSRVKTLSSFIWKCCTLASASISMTPRLSFSVHFMNIRRRTQPCLPKYSIGNLLWWAVAAYDIVDSSEYTKMNDNLKHFVELTDESMEEVNAEFLKSLEDEKGVEVVCEFLEQVNEIYSTNPEMFVFSSWLNFGINDLDFGLGKPVWVSLMGEVGPALRNFTIFKEFGDGIEAWITLDDDIMEIIEHDPEFLTFATPNPPIFTNPTSH
ncbi:HXXXD-type acyl-transferase family protein [Euphorbia peplus]|nr:HXXXD-type acyl-transferase family protein [Euphorbia peplus]